jgi:hypothetical protein
MAKAKLLDDCVLRAKKQAEVFELWYNPERNGETVGIMGLVKQIEERLGVRYVDAGKTSPEQRKRVYDDVILPLTQGRRGYFVAYAVRVTPGFPKDYDFGLRRPCLAVYGSKGAIDVYPHQENAKLEGVRNPVRVLVDVLEFLREFKASFS